jgi:putative peptidoglycan lipid II flippase
VLVNAFYAVDRRKTPMVVSFIAVLLNLILNWFFTFHLNWGHRGLAFSTACIATTNFLLLYLLMRQHLGRLDSGMMLHLLLRLVPACAVLAAVCWVGLHFLLSNWATAAFLPKAGALALVIAAGAAAFFVCATVLGISELREITQAVKRRLLRRV